MDRNVLFAIAAAALFGASTPAAKQLVGEVPPVLLAGLLYLGSGLGLLITRLLRDRRWRASGLAPGEWRWLLGAIVVGGIAAPVTLMFGLSRTSAASASLLLNLEAVLTALIAWTVFREHTGRRVAAGMLLIVAGGIVLAWPAQGAQASDWLGPAAIALACLLWAIDNNLTRRVSASDALFIAGSKGIVAGSVNTLLGLWLGASLPTTAVLLPTLLVGMAGYGISLVLFVLALRGLGTARTGAYFSTAPFIGAAIALTLSGESVTPAFWMAGALMAVGVWLHLTEQHGHGHVHEPMRHAHPHTHDEHHQHRHDFAWESCKSHSHPHEHVLLVHRHPHFPDIHHRHPHDP
jgi:drug/metabolite transporter (DMT)-like permease